MHIAHEILIYCIMHNAHSNIYSNNMIYTCPTMQYTSIHNNNTTCMHIYRYITIHNHPMHTYTNIYINVYTGVLHLYVYNCTRINTCILIYIRAHMATMHTCSHTYTYATQCYHIDPCTTLPYTAYTQTYICMHVKTNIYNIYIIIIYACTYHAPYTLHIQYTYMYKHAHTYKYISISSQI